MLELVKTENNEVKLMDENGNIAIIEGIEEVDESELYILTEEMIEKMEECI